MKNVLFAFICISLASSSALALEAAGQIVVERPFSIKRPQSIKENGANRNILNLKPGTYNFELYSHTQQEYGSCIPLLTCGNREPKENRYVTFSLLDNGKNPLNKPLAVEQVRMNAPFRWLNNEGVFAHYAKDTKQNFNMFAKEAWSDKNVNYRTETQECSVRVFCHSSGCSWAMGTQEVKVHTIRTTYVTQVKFTDLQNKPLATFKGVHTTDYRKVDETGACKLNFRKDEVE